jgi:glucose-1-phosphate thymidylyltransferase
VVESLEKPPTNLAIVGVYLLDNPALLYEGLDHIVDNNIRTKNEFQLTDALTYMLSKGDIMRSFEIEEWLDCGKPETLLDTNRRLLALEAPDKVEEYRSLYPTAVIIPPVVIGPNCKIERSVIGPYVSMRHDVEISGAILRDCTIAKGATLQDVNLHDSMIGEYASVEGVTGSLSVGDHSTIHSH